jgi:sulfur carrier protein
MKVILRNPRREVEVPGRRRVKELLKELEILPDTVLVIRGDQLLTADQVVEEADEIEIRPAISGGARGRSSRGASEAPQATRATRRGPR